MTVQHITEAIGKTVKEIEGLCQGSDSMEIRFTDGTTLRFWHYQDCCEDVRIEDVVGDAADFIGQPLTVAEERSEREPPGPYGDSSTWTFYEFACPMGTITVRWLGVSNGYYSEEVSYELLQPVN